MMPMATRHPIDWNALRVAVPVVDLAAARYGAPKRDKGGSQAQTAVFDAPDHGGVVIVHHREGYFKATDGTKGSGALDWLIRMEGLPLQDARQRLEQHVPTGAKTPEPPPVPRVYQPLRHVPAAWPAVRQYLVQARGLPGDLVNALRQAANLVTDQPHEAFVIYHLNTTVLQEWLAWVLEHLGRSKVDETE
jgi:hypothetical protein